VQQSDNRQETQSIIWMLLVIGMGIFALLADSRAVFFF
jgi:hypothetical protein